MEDMTVPKAEPTWSWEPCKGPSTPRCPPVPRSPAEHPGSPCITEPYPHPTFPCGAIKPAQAMQHPPGSPPTPVWGSAMQPPSSSCCEFPAASCPFHAAGKPADP